jgi:hypothetical protein
VYCFCPLSFFLSHPYTFNVPEFQLLIAPTAPSATVDRNLPTVNTLEETRIAGFHQQTIDFRVFLIDNSQHCVILLYVHRRRSTENFFCLLSAKRLYVISYVSLTFHLFFARKVGKNYYLAPTVSSGAASGPPAPCDRCPARRQWRRHVYKSGGPL